MTTVAVLVRRTPDPERLQMDRATGKLLTEGVPFVLNPVDYSALELAMRLKEKHGFRVVAVTVDEPSAEFEIREAIACGADEALLVADPSFAAQDPTMHARLFQLALEKWVEPDLIFAASRSTDHSWSTVGPQLAALLKWPLIIETEELSVGGAELTAVAHTGGMRARLTAKMPAVVTVARGVVPARHGTTWGLAKAFQKGHLVVKSLEDLGLSAKDREEIKPRTRPIRLALPTKVRKRTAWEGAVPEVGRILAQRVIDLGYAGRRQ